MIRLVQNSFFGGQLDFEMMGRQDYQRYAKGATKLCNFNILKRGGLDKRHGFDRVLDLKSTFAGVTENTKFRAIPFAYQKSHGFVILMSGPKCIAVCTSPVVQFRYYEVTGLDGVYSSSEIQELDYQQCGDEMFIAHQNHPPAKITHVIGSDGEHGFHYSILDMASQSAGIPSITASVTSRLPVQDEDHNAPLYTEVYKVSAVFNGVETFPCSEYSKANASPWGASYWEGTQYPMPWTESQKINLTIKPVTRTGESGLPEYPEEIRIYKKAYNYFGLIGIKKISKSDSLLAPTMTTSSYFTLQNSDGTSTNEFWNHTASYTPPSHGVGIIAKDFTVGNGTLYFKSDHSKKLTQGYITLGIGSCYYEIADDELSVTLHYVGWTATGIKVKIGSVTTTLALPRSRGDIVETIAAEDGESPADFEARWRARYADFVNEVEDESSVTIRFGKASSSVASATFYVVGGHLPINNFRVYEFASLSNISFDDNYITPDTSITPPEKGNEVIFDGEGNYPASVSLSQQRLIWASSKNEPARVWMSQIGDFYSYTSHEIQVADDPIDFTIPVTRFAKINHICEMRKLLMFNSACEWLVDSASSVQGLTFETIQAYPQSYSGSSERLKPIICNNSLIFCERTGQAVRRFAYDISNDGFAGRDVSVLSASIFENNSIVDWTYQQFPYSTLWCVMANGDMTSFEFMEEQDIMAWMTHRLGGGGKAVCVATSYAVSPALDEVTNADFYPYATHEEVFVVVKRGTSLWLERMRVRQRPPSENGEPSMNSLYHSLCLDGVRVLNSENQYQPTDEDGAIWIPSDTSDGQPISRDEALAKIDDGIEVYEGFPFDAEYISVYPNINNGTLGNGQFDIKHIQGCGLRLMNSTGGEVLAVGSDVAEPIQYYYNDPENDHRAVFEDGTVKLFNHDTNIMPINGVNNRDGRVKIVSRDPYPFSVLSYEIDFEPETGGFGGQR